MRTITSATVLLAATLLAAPTTGLEAQSDDAAMETVKSLRDAFFASYEAETPEEAAGQFAEDGVLMPPASPSARGGEAIAQRLETFTQGLTVSLQAISEESKELEGAILDRGLLGIETTPEGADEASTDTGKYVLLAEERDGSWRIVWLMWNTDNPVRVVDTQED